MLATSEIAPSPPPRCSRMQSCPRRIAAGSRPAATVQPHRAGDVAVTSRRPTNWRDSTRRKSVSSASAPQRAGGYVVQDHGQSGRAGNGGNARAFPPASACCRRAPPRSRHRRRRPPHAARVRWRGCCIRHRARDDPRATAGDIDRGANTSSCSAGESVGASPAVSQTTSAGTPAAIWRSHSVANALRSIASAASNGVGRSGIKPVNQAEGGMNMAFAEYGPLRRRAARGRGVCPCRARSRAAARRWSRVLSVLEQRVFDGLGAADEQAAIEAVLLLRDPLAPMVLADEDDAGEGTTRGRFDEFHGFSPSN